MKRRIAIKLMAFAMLAGLAMQSQAETRFNGTIDTAWTNAANWSAGVPTAILQARLQAAKTADIDSAAVAGGLNFRGNGTLGASVINVNNGGSLTSDGSDFSGVNRIGSNGDATLNINNGGSANFSGTGIFEVGESGGGDTGYVNVYTGGTLVVSQETQFGADGGTIGNLLVDGGTAVFSNTLAIAQAGDSTGTVTLVSGTIDVSGGNVEITDNSSAVGELVVQGGTFSVLSGSIQTRDGAGTITQSAGSINAKALYVGHLWSSTGLMNMSGGTNAITGELIIGNQEKDGTGCSGTLNMSGGKMVANNLIIGNEMNTTGTLTLSGTNTYLDVSTLRLGEVGAPVSSTINVEDGLFEINAIIADKDSSDENIHMAGGVLKLRHIDGATGFSNAVDLVEAGVITWTKGPLGSMAATYDPDLATMTWTNGLGTILYADTRTNNTHYYYMWAEAEMPVPSFNDWTADYSLSGGDEAFDANPDGDSLDNLAEYALGGNPTNGTDVAGVVPVSNVDGAFFQYVYNRRMDAADRGITYGLQNIDDLVGGTWTNEYTEVGTSAAFTDALGDSFESVTNTIPMDTIGFTKLKITVDE